MKIYLHVHHNIDLLTFQVPSKNPKIQNFSNRKNQFSFTQYGDPTTVYLNIIPINIFNN